MLKSWPTLLALSAAVLSGAQAGEPSHFTNTALRVIDAHDLVNEQDIEVTSSQQFLLTFKATQKVKDFLAGGFELRVFRANESGLPDRWAFYDPCAVYFSMVYSPQPSNNSLTISPLGIDWLNIAAHRVIPTKFLLVFEKPSDIHALFRLNTQNERAFFSHGLKLTVKPDQVYPPAVVDQLARDEADAAQNIYMPQASKNLPEFNCYRLSPVALHSPADSMHLAELTSCAPPLQRDTPGRWPGIRELIGAM